MPPSPEWVRRKPAVDDGARQIVTILAAVLSDGLPAVEAVDSMPFETFDDVAEHLPRFIADTYNGRRLHSALSYLSPKYFEDQLPRRRVKSAA